MPNLWNRLKEELHYIYQCYGVNYNSYPGSWTLPGAARMEGFQTHVNLVMNMDPIRAENNILLHMVHLISSLEYRRGMLHESSSSAESSLVLGSSPQLIWCCDC